MSSSGFHRRTGIDGHTDTSSAESYQDAVRAGAHVIGGRSLGLGDHSWLNLEKDKGGISYPVEGRREDEVAVFSESAQWKDEKQQTQLETVEKLDLDRKKKF